MLHIARSLFTCTELYVHGVGAVEVNNEDLVKGGGGWAGSVLMANIERESQFEKACALIKTTPPNL
jgi:hypothetical protein